MQLHELRPSDSCESENLDPKDIDEVVRTDNVRNSS